MDGLGLQENELVVINAALGLLDYAHGIPASAVLLRRIEMEQSDSPVEAIEPATTDNLPLLLDEDWLQEILFAVHHRRSHKEQIPVAIPGFRWSEKIGGCLYKSSHRYWLES